MSRWKFINTLPFRLSAAFTLLSILAGGAEFWILYQSWLEADAERIQRLNYEIAQTFAHRLQPDLNEITDWRGGDGQLKNLSVRLKQLEGFNPEIDLFVLDETGLTLASGSGIDPGEGVRFPADALEDMLTVRPGKTFPQYLPVPRTKNSMSAFSVARIARGAERGYFVALLVGEKSSRYHGALRDWYLFTRGAAFFAVMICAFSLFGAFLFYRITKRFRNFSSVVDQISGGEYGARADVQGSDEVAVLGSRINSMAATIAAQIETINANDQQRRQLVAGLAHDLREPVSVVQLAIEDSQLRFAHLSDSERMIRLKEMAGDIDRLSSMIDDLFELSKLEAKGKEPKCELFSVTEIIENDVLPKYRPAAARSTVQLRAEIAAEVGDVNADPQMIYRVLSNLVGNAIKYNRSGGEVCIHAQAEGTCVKITVSDTGPGIPEQDLPRIFERFFISSVKRASATSSGLGLAIVKRILELHGSEIHVESVFGSGTKFWFYLDGTIKR